MPTPNKGENRQSFMSRCMKQVNEEEDKKDWEQDRQVAYCYELWQGRDSTSKDSTTKESE